MTDRDKLLKLEKELAEIARRKKFNKLDFYEPYDKQQQFHDAGLTHRERLLMAGNQNGKTYCGAAEVAMHLTGRYPDWWLGRRWNRPTIFWVAGVTGESTRDNPQRLLIGRTNEGYGTGLIPHDAVNWAKDVTLARGVSDLLDTVLVKHASGGFSQLQFKSYEKGREKWQGDTIDGLWCDEEPPEDVYAEGLTRTAATGGFVFVTFTPLQGHTQVVDRFLSPKVDDPGVKDRHYTNMTIDDAKHISPEQRAIVVAGFLPHEREARSKGVPTLGSGRIFTTLESDFVVNPMQLPEHWSFLWGIDFGQDHPFAAVLLSWNRETDTVYVVHTYRKSDALPLEHVAAMKAHKAWQAPVAWPQDGTVRKEFEGQLKPVAQIYKKHGLRMLDGHAKFTDGSNSTEAGLLVWQERLNTNRFKCFATCDEWLQEYRFYHRKEGLIVKNKDDLMSATRVGLMQLRSARPVLFNPVTGQGISQTSGRVKGIDFDLFRT